MQRLFFGVSCGQDHVAAEASRLLLRLFAPAAGRSGAPPWDLPKVDSASVRGEATNNVEDSAIGQQAKMAALRQPGRSALFVPSGVEARLDAHNNECQKFHILTLTDEHQRALSLLE